MKGTLKRVMSGVLSVITIASAVAQPMTAYKQYISEWTMGLDIKILFKTVQVVFKKEGSM